MEVDLQLINTEAKEIPSNETINRWVTVTLKTINQPLSNLTIRVVDEIEITELNQRYRGKDKSTNVLAFPFEEVQEIEYQSLGDIVICFSVVKSEAKELNKSVLDHFAHMVIHGTLHLCGFDHQQDEEAKVMEEIEKGILQEININ